MGTAGPTVRDNLRTLIANRVLAITKLERLVRTRERLLQKAASTRAEGEAKFALDSARRSLELRRQLLGQDWEKYDALIRHDVRNELCVESLEAGSKQR
jgi:hypothetical protein